MAPAICDLHLHTTKSDGVWDPSRLFAEIRERGLDAFSVTDHDCIDAYPVPEDLRDRCIPGIEIDTEHQGHTAHVLAYGIEDKHCELLRHLRAQREERKARMAAMIARINALGIPMTMDDVLREAGRTSSLGRPHLARALVARGAVATVQEAFDKYLADEGSGYVALARLTAREIVASVHACGGVAIIAHPLRLRASGHLEELCALGADGIEVIHPTASPEDERRLLALARERNLLVTGGTDFHAPSDRPLGVPLERSDVQALRDAVARRRTGAASGSQE